jgi:formate hydrogenlyase subunit 5
MTRMDALLDGFAVDSLDARPPERVFRVAPGELTAAAGRLLDAGGRFVGVFVGGDAGRTVRALIALRAELVTLVASLDETSAYPSLSQRTVAALLPERELHDVSGVSPVGHPALEPVLRPNADDLPRRVTGDETFVIPYGPIRSGVFEAIQYPIDTGGEDVLALTVRPFFKRRNLEARMRGLPFEHGAYLAERIAAPAAVAHALAFAHAVERSLGVEAPARAERWRVVHAELERIANHLDVAVRLAEDAALSVGVARFGVLKEHVMRLRARLCGSRFGRGVVCPGGIAVEPLLPPADVIAALDELERDLGRDRRLLLRTSSFTDRLIGSGTLDPATVDRYGGVGPVARGCGLAVDARFERPYGGYRRLGFRVPTAHGGDAMARLEVRFDEIGQSLHLIRQALERFDRLPAELRTPLSGSGEACGWAEAPMGEVVYWVAVAGGAVGEAHIVSPSLRNWPLFAESFGGDVLTDVSFIEHSFGLTPAGADR